MVGNSTLTGHHNLNARHPTYGQKPRLFSGRRPSGSCPATGRPPTGNAIGPGGASPPARRISGAARPTGRETGGHGGRQPEPPASNGRAPAQYCSKRGKVFERLACAYEPPPRCVSVVKKAAPDREWQAFREPIGWRIVRADRPLPAAEGLLNLGCWGLWSRPPD